MCVCVGIVGWDEVSFIDTTQKTNNDFSHGFLFFTKPKFSAKQASKNRMRHKQLSMIAGEEKKNVNSNKNSLIHFL